MKILRLAILMMIATVVVACNNNDTSHFTVEGRIENGDSLMLYLEKRELSRTSVIDSVKLSKNGNFKFRGNVTPYPEFYVLRLGDQIINFATDSTETIQVDASKDLFSTDYSIKGVKGNADIKKVTLAQYKAYHEINSLKQKYKDGSINDHEYIQQIQNVANEYKSIAEQVILSSFKSPAAYFALFQKIDGLLFFDPYDKSDNKLFAAVATSWETYFPESPRADHLKNYTLIAIKALRQSNQQQLSDDEIAALTKETDASEYYNIELPNLSNEKKSLASLKGKVVLLDFTAYGSDASPAHNILLKKLYDKFTPNLEIYQVSLDSDRHYWANGATHIPWITVYANNTMNSDLIFKYNIQSLPTIFLLNRNGDIVKRILPTDNVESEIKKLI